jgi:hypothetical protein
MTNGGNPLDEGMPQQNGNAVKLAKQVKFMSNAGRGVIAGYRRGMYKDINFKVDPKCLDGDTQTYIVDALDIFGQEGFDWNTEILAIGNALNNIVDFCYFDESLNDYLTYCYEVEMCEPQNMIQTILKKVFQVTTVANDFAQMFGEALPKEDSKPQDIEDWFDRFGSNFGKLLRYATEFDPNVIPMI